MKRILLLIIIFIGIFSFKNINVKASVSNGFIIDGEVYETLSLNREVSNGWGYNSSSNTLILNNYNGGKIQIFVDDLNIELIGNNYINDIGIGIEIDGNLNIYGETGSLNINMSSDNSVGISTKSIYIEGGIYNINVIGVGIFASSESILINSSIVKIMTTGMGFQANRDITMNNCNINMRTNNLAIYSVLETINISDTKIVAISNKRVLKANQIFISDNSILALEGATRAIETDSLQIEENLPIMGGNLKEEIKYINEVNSEKYLYINREFNNNLPINLKVVKSGSKLILTWDNSINFRVLFNNQIYEILNNINTYEINITNVMDNYHLEVYSIDDDGIESPRIIKSISNSGNPDTGDNIFRVIYITIIFLCTLTYISKKLIDKCQSIRNK